MERVVADPPRLVALFLGVGDLVALAFDARLHNMVSADGAVVYVDVPGPERHCIPFLHFKSFCRDRFYHFDFC